MTETVREVIAKIVADPWGRVISRWNWKSALFGAMIRGVMFFLINRKTGRGVSASLAEFAFFICVAGFFGATTQNFRFAQPGWLARITVMSLVVGTTHTTEFILHHWIIHTPKAIASSIASTCFTLLSTTFSFFVMRRGAMVIGSEGNTFANDMQRMPLLVLGFITAPFKVLFGIGRADDTKGMGVPD